MREPSDTHETETVAPETVREWSGPPRLADGTVVGGRYEIRGVFGSGGSSIVYRAWDRLIRGEIALKVLRADRLTANALIRLRREATAARDVVHPNLIRVYDLGTADELTFLAMEAIAGESLRERLRSGLMAIEEAVKLAADVLRGLSALHEAGLLHRDVKPGNVLIAADGTIKLADLGLVRRWQRDETRVTESEAVIGTFEYLSPEQALGEELDVRSDLYSLGAMLYEMLAGRLPHAGKSSLGTLLANLRQPVPDLRSIRCDAPRWLSGIVAHLLERERDQRYGSAAEVLADLDRRRAPGGRARWRARNRRRWVGAAVALALASFWGAGAWLNRPVFDRVVGDGSESVRALDTRGRVLWRFEDVAAERSFARVRMGSGRPDVVAAVFGFDETAPTVKRQTLHLLDPLSGETIERIELPSAAAFFPGMADRYGRELTALDVDGDGVDEVLVVFSHLPFWPSFTVLCEPRLGRCRNVFVASGHHRPFGAADVDGDGRNELLLAGINNRMGFFSAVAAVRIRPEVGAVTDFLYSGSVASSPDELRVVQDLDILLWYALLPPGFTFPAPRSVRIDSVTREIVVPYRDGSDLRLGFDGFVIGEVAPEEGGVRARASAYEELRQFHRLLGAGDAAAASEKARLAVASAAAAGDPRLAEWAGRMLHRGLVAEGRIDEAAAVVEELLEVSATGPEVAWEAARSLHLAGHVERAIPWYERALSLDSDPERGRFIDEFLEGLVLACAEAGRWELATAAVDRWPRSQQRLAAPAAMLRTWLAWRLGRPAPTRAELEAGERVLLGSAAPDLWRYLGLELALAEGVPAAELMPALADELTRASDTVALVLSLEGELLARLGRLDEARAKASEALGRARRELDVNIYSRAHLPLLEERVRKLGL